MMKAVQTAVGLDLGGTMARAGLITSEGKLICSSEIEIEAKDGPDAGIARLSSLVEQLTSQNDAGPIVGIGIGATGPLDIQAGKIQNPYTLPGWEDVQVAVPLQQKFGVPVYLENDADAAALGEYWLGAGQGVRRLAAVTVGTGVGTSLVLDGKIYRGIQDCHPEGGHMLLDPHGPECYCGANGCWESFCAGPSIVAYTRRLLQEGSPEDRERWAQFTGDELSAAKVIAAARQNDPIALKAVEQAAFYMGLGIVNIVNILAPEKIVLSGGVMKSLDLFLPAIQAALKKNNQMVPADHIEVLPASLGYYAGIFGSAYRVYQQFVPN